MLRVSLHQWDVPHPFDGPWKHPQKPRRSLSLMGVNVFCAHVYSHPIDPKNHSFTIKCTLAYFHRVGEEYSAVHSQGFSAFSPFIFQFCPLKSVTLTVFSLLNGVWADSIEWQYLAAKEDKMDTLSATMGTDSSYGPSSFIIPSSCLNLYLRGRPVLHL